MFDVVFSISVVFSCIYRYPVLIDWLFNTVNVARRLEPLIINKRFFRRTALASYSRLLP